MTGSWTSSVGAFAVLLWALAGCRGGDGETSPAKPSPPEAEQSAEPSAEPPASETEEGAGAHMDPNIESGPIPGPDELDVRLARRDADPLPEGALVRFQVIGRSPDPSNNYRWVFYEDGRVFGAGHSGDTSDWQTPFDVPIPEKPTAEISRFKLKRIERKLEKSDFGDQPPYQRDPRTEDGSYYVVTARVGGEVHEVIYEGWEPPLVELLASVSYEE